MTETQAKHTPQQGSEEVEQKSFLRVIVHSFFIIPFMIAVLCALLFGMMHLLTREQQTAHDFLEDIKIGGRNKRWQGAFELAKMLSQADPALKTDTFIAEMVSLYEKSGQDDPRVRQYLALAMGRAGWTEFGETLRSSLPDVHDDVRPAVIMALGMLKDPQAIKALKPYVDDPSPRVRSITMAALGEIGTKDTVSILKKGLQDTEPNVKWGSAIALAHLQDASGLSTLLNLLNRDYYDQFKAVDQQERVQLMLAAIAAAEVIRQQDPRLRDQIQALADQDPNMKIKAAAFKFLEQ